MREWKIKVWRLTQLFFLGDRFKGFEQERDVVREAIGIVVSLESRGVPADVCCELGVCDFLQSA